MGRTANDLKGYRAYLPTESRIPGFTYIGFHGFALVLSKTNVRKSKCIECQEPIDTGQGIYQREYRHNGFLHLNCAKKLIFKYGGELGFTENFLYNLQACCFIHGKFTARQVADSIRPFDPMAELEPEPLAEMPAASMPIIVRDLTLEPKPPTEMPAVLASGMKVN